MISYIMQKIVGSQNQREIKRLGAIGDSVNEFESEYLALPNSAFTKKTEEFKERIKNSLNGNGDSDDEAHFKRLEETVLESSPKPSR